MFILYSTLGCHLCDDAMAILSNHLCSRDIRKVDIADDEALMDEYGVRIPVVRNSVTGAEIGWPFNDAIFAQWLAEKS